MARNKKPSGGFVSFHHSDHRLSGFEPQEKTVDDLIGELSEAMTKDDDDEFIRLLKLINDKDELSDLSRDFIGDESE